MTIVSIDTGDPKSEQSTTAIVKMSFSNDNMIRKAMTYHGSFDSQKERILAFCEGADRITIEKIDDNAFLKRSVIEEQISIAKFLESAGHHPQELIRSGRVKIITDSLLKILKLWDEGPHETHHHDVREATRNLLYFMAKDEIMNAMLSHHVRRYFKP